MAVVKVGSIVSLLLREGNTVNTAGAGTGATNGVICTTALLVAQMLEMAAARVVRDHDSGCGGGCTRHRCSHKLTGDRALRDTGGTGHRNLIRQVEVLLA